MSEVDDSAVVLAAHEHYDLGATGDGVRIKRMRRAGGQPRQVERGGGERQTGGRSNGQPNPRTGSRFGYGRLLSAISARSSPFEPAAFSQIVQAAVASGISRNGSGCRTRG